jgi:F-type H+-transporting ATPase subunit a
MGHLPSRLGYQPTLGGELAKLSIAGVMRDQIGEISRRNAPKYLPFTGTLFQFIAVSNLLTIVPGYAALALK